MKNKIYKFKKIYILLSLISLFGTIAGSIILYFGTNYIGTSYRVDEANQTNLKIKYGYGISNWCAEWDLNGNELQNNISVVRAKWNNNYFTFVNEHKKIINDLKKQYVQNHDENIKVLINAYYGAINAYNLFVSGIVILPFFSLLLIINLLLLSIAKSQFYFKK